MSTVFKRFEIWILLAIVVAGIWWAFDAETIPEVTEAGENQEAVESPASADNPEETALLEIRSVDVTPGEGGSIVALTLFGKSGTEEPVSLGEGNLELLTTEGEGVHRFFLPFDPDPMLAPDEKSLVTVRYWLKVPAEVLWLTYRDQTVKVEIPTATS